MVCRRHLLNAVVHTQMRVLMILHLEGGTDAPYHIWQGMLSSLNMQIDLFGWALPLASMCFCWGIFEAPWHLAHMWLEHTQAHLRQISQSFMHDRE